MADAKKLTIKQEKFCNKYLECGNASEAYRYAYNCKDISPTTINRKAVEVLENGKIAARIKSMQDKLAAVSNITKERILSELDAILEARITDYVNLVTKQVPIPQTKKEIKANAPIRYIDVQTLVFKDFDELTDKQIKAIESIKQGRCGIELKLHGKSWTIERICKMLGYDAPEKIANTDSKGEDVPTFNVERLFKLIQESRAHE